MAEEQNKSQDLYQAIEGLMGDSLHHMTTDHPPVALFWGISAPNSEKAAPYPEMVKPMVETLRESGVDAVPFFSEEVTDPAKTVVSPTGLQTPFIEASEAPEIAKNIASTCYEKFPDLTYSVMHPVQESQLLEPGHNSQTKEDAYYKNMQEQARQSIEHPNTDDIEQSAFDNAVGKDTQSYFRGGTFGSYVQSVWTQPEGKATNYVTRQPQIASSYSYGNGKDGQNFPTVVEFEGPKNKTLYTNYGIETGGGANKQEMPTYESCSTPGQDIPKALYFSCDKNNEDQPGRLLKIPTQTHNGQLHITDPQWKEYYGSYQPREDLGDYLAQRRQQIKQQAHDNQKPATYPVIQKDENGQSLPQPAKDFSDQSHLSAEQFLKNVCPSNQINKEATGHIVCSTHIDFGKTGIQSFPVDFQKIHFSIQEQTLGNHSALNTASHQTEIDSAQAGNAPLAEKTNPARMPERNDTFAQQTLHPNSLSESAVQNGKAPDAHLNEAQNQSNGSALAYNEAPQNAGAPDIRPPMPPNASPAHDKAAAPVQDKPAAPVQAVPPPQRPGQLSGSQAPVSMPHRCDDKDKAVLHSKPVPPITPGQQMLSDTQGPVEKPNIPASHQPPAASITPQISPLNLGHGGR